MKLNRLVLPTLCLAVLLCGCSNDPLFESYISESTEPVASGENAEFEFKPPIEYGYVEDLKNDALSGATMVSLDEVRRQMEEGVATPDNINIDKIKVILPENDLSFSTYNADYNVDPDQVMNHFKNDIDYFSGEDICLDSLFWDTLFLDVEEFETTPETVPAIDTKEYFERGRMLLYGDEGYKAALYPGTWMFEICDTQTVHEISPEWHVDNIYPIRPFGSTGMVVKTYYPLDEEVPDVSYTLRNGDVSVRDAIEYVEQEMDKYWSIQSDDLTQKVSKVEVWELESYSYFRFEVVQFKDGYRHDSLGGSIMDPDTNQFTQKTGYSPEHASVIGVRHYAAMVDTDRLCYIWSGGNNFADKISEQHYTEYLSYEDALKCLGSSLTSGHEFRISQVKVGYITLYTNTSNMTTSRAYSIPVYEFKVGDALIQGYSSVNFYVNMQNGIIYIMAEEW